MSHVFIVILPSLSRLSLPLCPALPHLYLLVHQSPSHLCIAVYPSVPDLDDDWRFRARQVQRLYVPAVSHPLPPFVRQCPTSAFLSVRQCNNCILMYHLYLPLSLSIYYPCLPLSLSMSHPCLAVSRSVSHLCFLVSDRSGHGGVVAVRFDHVAASQRRGAGRHGATGGGRPRQHRAQAADIGGCYIRRSTAGGNGRTKRTTANSPTDKNCIIVGKL